MKQMKDPAILTEILKIAKGQVTLAQLTDLYNWLANEENKIPIVGFTNRTFENFANTILPIGPLNPRFHRLVHPENVRGTSYPFAFCRYVGGNTHYWETKDALKGRRTVTIVIP